MPRRLRELVARRSQCGLFWIWGFPLWASRGHSWVSGSVSATSADRGSGRVSKLGSFDQKVSSCLCLCAWEACVAKLV